MPKIKDIPKVDRPREKFLEKGPDALSKSDLLAILIGSGIKGTNVRSLADYIVKKFKSSFLDLTVEDLLQVNGIGEAKALQIVSAIALIKRFVEEKKPSEKVILSAADIVYLNNDIKDKKKEYLICLYLNARNVLIRKEVISVGTINRSIIHPREIFGPAVELRSASIALVHNHPSGDPTSSPQDIEVVNKLAEAGSLMGIPMIDFIIIAGEKTYSFFEILQKQNHNNIDYICDGIQYALSDLIIFETGKIKAQYCLSDYVIRDIIEYKIKYNGCRG